MSVAVLTGVFLLGFGWMCVPTGGGGSVAYTEIVLDGDPSDWTDYKVGRTDSRNDARGDVEIIGLRVFANDTYLYVLVEIASGVGGYSQLDVDINPRDGLPEFMANARPDASALNLGRFENGERFGIEIVGELASGAAFEMRFPLEAFGGTVPEQVAVRVMGGGLAAGLSGSQSTKPRRPTSWLSTR